MPGRTRPGALLLGGADAASVAQLAVVDPDVEPALGIAAHPRLEGDGGSVAAVVAQRKERARTALTAGGKLGRQVHRAAAIVSIRRTERTRDSRARTPGR